jgi:hypothetical protein
LSLPGEKVQTVTASALSGLDAASLTIVLLLRDDHAERA